jgi:hypothetical protein
MVMLIPLILRMKKGMMSIIKGTMNDMTGVLRL